MKFMVRVTLTGKDGKVLHKENHFVTPGAGSFGIRQDWPMDGVYGYNIVIDEIPEKDPGIWRRITWLPWSKK